MRLKEQRDNVKFCVEFCKTFTECAKQMEKKQCLGPECMSGTSASQVTVFERMMIHVQEDPDRQERKK
ncbi:hypothetical protein ANN_14521 [Periplaneta americana]|uniref:Uncharacterized protein n=1 Tax=Periplaneta americana TaxID=6978 RepID=A0ABQ8SXM0_PERAM|nr:hypothetical protein ANN_14521 [Periplaneta americana]